MCCFEHVYLFRVYYVLPNVFHPDITIRVYRCKKQQQFSLLAGVQSILLFLIVSLSFSLMRMAQPFTQLSPPSVLDLILCSTSTVTSVLLRVTSNQVRGSLVLNQTVVLQYQLPRLKPQALKLGETRMPAVHAEVTGVRVTTLASLPAADWMEVKVCVVCSMREGTPPLTVAIFSLCCCSHAAWCWCRTTCTKFTCTASRRSLRTRSPIK